MISIIMNNNNTPIENILHDFNTFTQNYNTNVQQILQTYNSIVNTYQQLVQRNISQPRQQHRRSHSPIGPTMNSIFSRYDRNRNRNRTRYRGRTRNNGLHTTLDNNGGSLFSTFPESGNTYFNQLFTGTFPTTFLDPVNVTPTSEQIENATETILFGTFDTNQVSCPIDLGLFVTNEQVIRIKHCGHIFRHNNLISWFNSSCRCPICRYDIREYDASANVQFDQDDEVDTGGGGTPPNTRANTSDVEQVSPEQGEHLPTIEVTNSAFPENVTTIEIDANIVPLPNSTINADVVSSLQQQIGGMLTDTIVNTFQTFLDPCANNVDIQYTMFNQRDNGSSNNGN